MRELIKMLRSLVPILFMTEAIVEKDPTYFIVAELFDIANRIEEIK